MDSYVGSTLLAYEHYKKYDDNLILFVPNSFDATKIYNALLSLIDKENIIILPSDDLIRVEYISESKEIRCELIYGLYRIRKATHSIILATPNNLFRYLPTKEVFDDNFINLKVNDELDLEKLKNKLTKLGYDRVSKIDQSLEFAFRGGVIDIFSLNYEHPIRIELFDNIIESIRFFNIDTQTSFEEVNEVTVIPATINLLSDEELKKAKNKLEIKLNNDLARLDEENKNELKNNIENEINELLNNVYSNKFYKYYGFLQDIHENLNGYLNNFSIINTNYDDFNKAKDMLFKEATDFLPELKEANKAISGLSYFNESAKLYGKENELITLNSFYTNKDDVSIPIRNLSYLNPKNMSPKLIVETLLKNKEKLILTASDEREINNFKALIEDIGLTYKINDGYDYDETCDININKVNFSLSFEILNDNLIILSYKDVFLEKNRIKTYTTRFKQGKILESYEELEPGDYVVHEKYGIGKFNKIETIEIEGKHNDYLEILYDKDDKVYVPLYQFNLVRKYVGKEGARPRLSSLNSTKWEKTKQKIKERVNDLADRLLTLYQERASLKGIEFKKDDEIQEAFEHDFHHDLTSDQARAIKEIKEDMEAPHPMDRLLCGDVGFGKTEVAFEAAMKAILSEKQVCLLCPTTVLAMQHYKVAIDRFKNFKINIALLTRMTTAKEKTEIVKKMKDGSLNLLIGTHKIFSSSKDFKDLGLLIIDEEQRFGVEQKEKIKELFTGIDVLTLSATPIPRTLQSSLVGLKSISKIETAPSERLPIQTYVVNYDEGVVKELIKRELARDGQIFYVHNDIASIYLKEEKLKDLVPSLRIGIVHGKMDKEDIDEVMQSFYDHEIDLLLATTIIENGIDVRNANLLIVEDADKFGLAQLYQIKGRVGRGDKIAFAYLMINSRKEINEESKKRLKAIQDFTELGSGYKIAQRDLLIRGAGDILGKEQAGFIDEVGIDMYLRLLNETMKEKREGKKDEKSVKEINNLSEIDAYIPKNFAKSDEKIEIYQKLLDINSLDGLQLYKSSLADQYGKLPQNVEYLFLKRKINIYMNEEEFETYNEYKDRLTLVLSEKFSEINGIGSALFTGLLNYVNKIKISYKNHLIYIDISKNLDDWLDTFMIVLETVSRIYKSKRKVIIAHED